MNKELRNSLCQLEVQELIYLLENSKITSEELISCYVENIKKTNEQIFAFIETFEEMAIKEARLSDIRRKKGESLSEMDGIPIAIKDNIAIKGQVVSCASKMLCNYISPYDATVIKKIKKIGMPILGRLNMDEFAMGGSTETSFYGVTKNPNNIKYVAGGSSGGAAAAIAAFMAPYALASDTGGSIRQPASYCGVVGVKPAYGAISRYGLVAFASSLDQIGIISKSINDADLLLPYLCGKDARDATSKSELSYIPFKSRLNSLDNIRICVIKEPDNSDITDEVSDAMKIAISTLKKLGAEISEINVQYLEYALSTYYIISSAEASSNLARYDGVCYGHRSENFQNISSLQNNSRIEGFGEEVKKRIMLGNFVLSNEYQAQYYRKALSIKERMSANIREILKICDVIISPISPAQAFKIDREMNLTKEMYLQDRYNVLANLVGLPALSVPIRTDKQKLPIGLGMMCDENNLPMLMEIASVFERKMKELSNAKL